MRNLLNPRWIFIANTFPLVLLLCILFSEFTLIKSLLKEDSIQLWMGYGLTLAAMGILNLFYGLYLTVKRKPVPVGYGIITLLAYIAYLYGYYYCSEKMMPWSIPNWMVSGDAILYAGTFLMPTLVHALFVLVLGLTPDEKEAKAWKNFLAAVAVPVTWYLFAQVAAPLWRDVDYRWSTHTVIILCIAGTILFLFFLVRTAYIIGVKKTSLFKQYELVWKIPLAIVFPLLGLAINNGHLLHGYRFAQGIFGDFGNPWFYILAVVNGLLICAPAIGNRTYRLLLFIGRSITLAYTFYFFLVFLPFLPLSVFAILGAGIGFLMLTPLVLMVIHSGALYDDLTWLKNFFSGKLLGAIAVLGFMLIPVLITFNYIHHRTVLNNTLNYLYKPDYSKTYDADTASLANTLGVIKGLKEGNRDFIMGRKIPYLSRYFTWLVLDNLTLSDTKIGFIESVFLGGPVSNTATVSPPGAPRVIVSDIHTKSTYDTAQHTWKSQVDLDLKNTTEQGWQVEFATAFNLPTGCFISDYYLWVNDKKEPGILAEKKAAMWVYNQIVNTRRDPGILRYLTGNRVQLRVFPFTPMQTRQTGIEFIHKEPVTLNIDGHIVTLGDATTASEAAAVQSTRGDVTWVSAQQKEALPKVRRKPYYHFIVDVSKGREPGKKDFIQRIEKLLSAKGADAENAQISFVNSATATFPLKAGWQKQCEAEPCQAGFYLDRAIKETLFNAYTSRSNTRPVIVVVTDHMEDAIIENDFADFKMAWPEGEVFYRLTQQGTLEMHSLSDTPWRVIENLTAVQYSDSVLAYPNEKDPVAYLADNHQPEIILNNERFDLTGTPLEEKNWRSALALQGSWITQVLHPETAEKQWLSLVQGSFKTRVLTPVTAYMVVEDEAQKEALRRKQEQVLSGNKALDPGEEIQRGSEPGVIFIGMLLLGVLWYRNRRRPVAV